MRRGQNEIDKRVLHLRGGFKKGPNRDLFGSLFIFQGPYMHEKLDASVLSNLFMKMVSIFAGTGSVLHCWQIWIVTSANAFNFINSFWVPILASRGPYFTKLCPHWK